MYKKFFDKEKNEVVFILHGVIEVRIPKKIYEKYRQNYGDEEIISFCPHKNIYNAITKRKLYYITKESGVPLIGHTAFGIIDRGTNLLQVRPCTGCNLNCIFCSVDEGKSKTRVTDYMVDVDYLVEKFEEVADFKRKYCNGIEAHIDGQGEPFIYPYIIELIRKLSKIADIVSIQTNGMLITKNMIKKLENIGILKIERDRKDRRKAIYKPNIEKAKTETRKFQVEEFLSSLENPESFEETRKIEDMKITFSIFIEGKQKKAKLPPSIILEGAFPTIKAWVESYMKPAKLQKFALFIGAEKGNK